MVSDLFGCWLVISAILRKDCTQVPLHNKNCFYRNSTRGQTRTANGIGLLQPLQTLPAQS